MNGELTALRHEENLKSYYEILEISLKNPTVPVSYRSTENDQIYQQRVQDIKYQGIEAVIVFVQNVTNIQKLQALEA